MQDEAQPAADATRKSALAWARWIEESSPDMPLTIAGVLRELVARDERASEARVDSAEAKLATAVEALRAIADGTLGPSQWKAHHERITEVAREALAKITPPCSP